MRLTILVVEDDHALRDVLVRGLRDEGFGTLAARLRAALKRSGPVAPTATGDLVLDPLHHGRLSVRLSLISVPMTLISATAGQ
ncbi:hypothetical protein ACFTZI_26160 [Streptomyces decoyicus]|uniref:hypothetical protein n=1 Tax=Streptomyces decoyicus TaxID=249567 RepID=UPI003627B5CC